MKKIKKIVAIIPARGGSTRLKKKNIYPVLGKPMIQYTIDACKKSSYDIEIWVSTDCQKIKKIALELNTNIHNRSKINANSESYKQAAIREAADFIIKKKNIVPDIILSLQANSPTITNKEIDKCINALLTYNRDEIVSVDKNLMQDAAIRVFRSNYVFQKDLSTNFGVVVTDLFDVHTIEDVKHVESLLLKK